MDLHTFQNFFPLRSNSETSSTNNKDSNDYSPIAKKQNQSEARDRDRNFQINGSHEEIFFVYEHIFLNIQNKHTFISSIESERQNFAFTSSKCSIMVVWG